MQTGRCRNHTSFVNTRSLSTAVSESRSGHGWSVCTSAENRADLDTKSLFVHTFRQLVQWNGLVLDRHENSVISDTEDGQDEKEQLGRHREDGQDVNDQRGVAVHTNRRSWAKGRKNLGRIG